ncbi:MAG: TraB/GumN family protein [Pseudomonadota bacterium]|nr:TraB/GumN family protein [Pseudomonadota bacterium]
MKIAVIFIAFFISLTAAASSLRVSKLAADFLAHRVDKVDAAVKLDLLLQTIREQIPNSGRETTAQQQLMRRITSHPKYVRGAFDELERYAQNITVKRGMFWRLRSPDGSVHHLFGTMHDMRLQRFDGAVVSKLEQVIDASDLLLGEMAGNPAIRSAKLSGDFSLERGLLDELESLDDQISLLAMLNNNNLKELDTPEDIVAAIRSTGVQVEDLNYSADITTQLQDRVAQIDKIDTTTTQTSDDKLTVLDEFGSLKNKLTGILIEAIADEQIAASYMSLNYARADVGALLDGLRFGTADTALLDYRNKLWADRIATECQQQQSCFIYAGIYHMLAETKNIRSLISLLEERGFKVEATPLD